MSIIERLNFAPASPACGFAGLVQKTWFLAVGTETCEFQNFHLSQIGRENLCLDQAVGLEQRVAAEKVLLLLRAVEKHQAVAVKNVQVVIQRWVLSKVPPR